MLSLKVFLEEVSKHIEHDLKAGQIHALEVLHEFFFFGDKQSAFILLGYAGTGKTTLMAGLINWLRTHQRKTVLLAPTGRSAKVLSAHSNLPASTIHRRIYSVKQGDDGRFKMSMARNTSENTYFIVDEASMIGGYNADDWQGRSLLDDLIAYVQSGTKCRIIFIGDDAQLPTVGSDLSPSLNKEEVDIKTGAKTFTAVLTEVARQQQGSLILENATTLRDQLNNDSFGQVELQVDKSEDVVHLDPYDLQDKLESCLSGSAAQESIIICRSNKEANMFNQQIRQSIHYRESILEAGDRLMIVKNNYFWKLKWQKSAFLANGDMLTVERIHQVIEVGESKFAEVQIILDGSDGQEMDMWLFLDPLGAEGPSVSLKQIENLYPLFVSEGLVEADDPYERFYQSPFYNAVQVKYAYAVTCHKSQGGQWKNVFLSAGYLREDMIDKSYLRWLYTAITRATTNLYLINFPSQMITLK